MNFKDRAETSYKRYSATEAYVMGMIVNTKDSSYFYATDSSGIIRKFYFDENTTHITVEPVEVAVEPVEVAVEPVEVAVEPVEVAVEPVEVAVEPVEVAVEPVEVAVEPVEVASSKNGKVSIKKEKSK